MKASVQQKDGWDPLEAYREYTVNVVQLMIYYTWFHGHHAELTLPVSRILDEQVDIKRKTTLTAEHPNPDREWARTRDELARLIEAHGDVNDTEPLEATCWEFLSPIIEPVLVETCPRSYEKRDRPYGCWSHVVLEDEPAVVALHFENVYQPESPFHSHSEDLTNTLLRLLHDVQKSHPAVTRVWCGSWMNQLEAFLNLFPSSWASSVFVLDTPDSTWGWWGQYMDHRGGFHAKNAIAMRKTGIHPYRAGFAESELSEVMAHLREIR